MVRILLLAFAGAILFSSCRTENLESIEPRECDTTSMSFQADILPITQHRCSEASCHSGGNPAGGIRLTDYSGVRQVAESSRLMGAITHEPGYQPMPLGRDKLPDCEIKKIKAWIDQGMQDN